MLIFNFKLAHQMKLVNEITGFDHAFATLKCYLACGRTYQIGRQFDMVGNE
jgi:hypothetical protein